MNNASDSINNLISLIETFENTMNNRTINSGMTANSVQMLLNAIEDIKGYLVIKGRVMVEQVNNDIVENHINENMKKFNDDLTERAAAIKKASLTKDIMGILK
jgi:hypothetical protein